MKWKKIMKINKTIFIISLLTSSLSFAMNREKKDIIGLELIEAIKNENKNKIKKLIQTKPNVNIQDEDGYTSLMYAAFNWQKETVELLINLGADVNIKNKEKSNALMNVLEVRPLLDDELVFKSDLKYIVELLINTEIDIKAKNKNGYNALMLASLNGHAEIVELLINIDQSIIDAQENDGYTALMFAAFNNNKQIVELLVHYRADLEIKTNNGKTAFIIAAENGLEEIAELLINAGTNISAIDNCDESAIFLAIKNGYIEIVKLLLKAGININIQNNIKDTPLICAAHYNQKDIVELLIKSGAKIDMQNIYQLTALSRASSSQIKDFIIFAKMKRPDILKYKNILFDAVKSGDYYKVKELVKKVTLNIHDQNGNNVLHLAIINNKFEIFKLLLILRPDLAQEKNGDGKNCFQINPGLYHHLNLSLSNIDNLSKKRKRE